LTEEGSHLVNQRARIRIAAGLKVRENRIMRRVLTAAILTIALSAVLVASANASVRETKAPGRVPVGEFASVTVAVKPRSRCTIGVYYTTRKSEAAGLGAKTAETITWRWRVGTNTIPGRFPVKIDCGAAGKASTTIRVVD
jgi:hypothetical protein